MTQILAALTQEYVLVASDRQLTIVGGPRNGQIHDDDTCKLVLLCGIWGIAYTGFAQLEGAPTHEWIATRLAKENCQNPYVAAQILAAEGARALKAGPFLLELTFLIAGWARLEGKILQPHFLLVTNKYHEDGNQRDLPGENLHVFERRLQPKELYAARVIGQPLVGGRGKYLDRCFRRMLRHKTSPKPAMEAFAKEIAHTAERTIGVGKKVLAFSIPRKAARRAYESGGNLILAMEPNMTSMLMITPMEPLRDQLMEPVKDQLNGAMA